MPMKSRSKIIQITDKKYKMQNWIQALHCHRVSKILVEGELSAAEQRNRVLSLTTEQVVTAKCVWTWLFNFPSRFFFCAWNGSLSKNRRHSEYTTASHHLSTVMYKIDRHNQSCVCLRLFHYVSKWRYLSKYQTAKCVYSLNYILRSWLHTPAASSTERKHIDCTVLLKT